MSKKILLCCPVRQDEETFVKYLNAIDKLVIPDGYKLDKLFYLHNSDGLKQYLKPGEYRMLQTEDEYTKGETHEWEAHNLQYVTAMRNYLCQYVLDKNYDYYFSVDSDLILQPNTLKALLDANKDIVAECFWTSWTPDEPPAPNAWHFDSYTFENGWEKKVEYSYDAWLEPGLYKVGMTGACKLVKRKVLESGVNYSQLYNVLIWGEDRYFCIRAAAHGFEIWLDTHYPPEHLYR